MNFGERSKIKSIQKMIQFLESERIGRFATIDKNGFPFIVPMNFVFFNEPGVGRTMADDGQTVEWLELTGITAARWSIIRRDWFLQAKSLYCNSDICLERQIQLTFHIFFLRFRVILCIPIF
jgi:pyridoxamine 5'-phosphate oxidase-like protein